MGTYYDEYKNKVKTSTDEQKSVLKTQQTTADQIALDRLNADNEALEQGYGTQIDETKSSYDTALRTNEVQRALNERSIARRMAEMGLTDSGLNRTQSTAVQLSYANQKGNLIANRQKAVDTLAATMRNQMAQNQLTYNENVANNKLAYESGVADIDAKVDADAITYESERIKADNEAIAKKNTARTNLYSILGDQSKSQSEMTAAINSYALSYGLSDEEQAEFTRLANQTLTDAAASAFAKEAEKEVSSLESFIYSSGNNDKAKYAKITSAYNKGYISSDQKAYYDSLVSAVSTEGEGNNSFDETYTKISELGDSDLNYSAKTVYDFAYENDLDMNDPKYKILLDKSGLTQDDMDRYIISGSIYSDGSEYTDANASGVPTGRVVWDYNTDGALNYNFEITDATWNWGGLFNAFKTVDGNDKVTIKYPDGTLVAEDVRIDQLPKSIQQTITDATAGKKKGDTFTARVNLKGLRLN